MKTLKHISPISRAHLSIFILIFAAIGGIAIWRSLAATNPNLPGDLNGDNTVNITDLSILLSNYGTTNTAADINGDGTVNVLDLSVLLSHYGQSVSTNTTTVDINSGGSAASPYAADTGFSGGNTSSTTSAVDTSGVSNPAPQAVYQTERYGDFSYTIGGFAANSAATVNLHFAEVYWTSTGQRTFNVSINGSQVLTNFDIIAAAGAANKAVVKSFSATTNSSGQVVISFSSVVNYAKISGIEVTSGTGSGGGGGTSNITHPQNGLGLDTAGKYVTDYSNVNSYGLVIVSAQGAPQAKSLSALTLIYSDASQIVSSYTEGLDYATASANGCIVSQISSGHYLFDHSKSSCNQLMADADVAYVKNNGMKGMFADDTVPIYNSSVPSGWEQGMVSFIHLLHQELNANGLYLLANANAYSDQSLGGGDDAAGDLNWAKQLAPDGIMEESWMMTRDGNNVLRPSGNAWNQEWDQWENTAKQIQAAGMDFIGLSYNMNATYEPYTYASTLMADAGHIVYMAAHTDGTDPWNSLLTTNLGSATSSTTVSGSGRYKTYASGKAAVNTGAPGTSPITILGLSLGPVSGYVGQ